MRAEARGSMREFTVRTADELSAACKNVEAGDTIRIVPGRYNKPSCLKGKRGPILIRQHLPGRIDGGQSPDPFWGDGAPHEDGPGKPHIGDYAFLILDKCHDIVIDGLHVENCWPSIFFIKDSARIVIRNCKLKHGVFAIFLKGAAGPGEDDGTFGYLIDNNEWQQDDSPDHKLWTRYDWGQAHGGEGEDGRYRYFNGAFVGGKGLVGGVIVRRNIIMDAYNGVRLKAEGETFKPGDFPRINADVHIFDNDFIRIRDNPLEPEAYALNWHVRHNRLLDCHSWFSFDGVAGGHWYFYGNTGRFETRQGQNYDKRHTMGRVLKLSYEPFDPEATGDDVPSAPWYVFNNSWYLRCPLIGGSDPASPGATEGPDFTSHLDFFNNAMQWCDPGAHGDDVCEIVPLAMNFDWTRSSHVNFAGNLCNRADFTKYLNPAGEVDKNLGIIARRRMFTNGLRGDFSLAPCSEACGTGVLKSLMLSDRSQSAIKPDDEGKLNIGAFQRYGLTSVPELEEQAALLIRKFPAI